MNFDHVKFPLDDETAEATIGPYLPLFTGKFGLIVIRLDKETSNPLSYWHEAGFEQDFGDDHAEYPRLFQTLKGATSRMVKLVEENPTGGAVVMAAWCHPDWDPCFPPDTRYSLMRNLLPGSARGRGR